MQAESVSTERVRKKFTRFEKRRSKAQENMAAFIHKMILAIVLVNLALVLAKPYNFDEETGLFRDDFFKRATDCGSGRESEGPYSRKCRSSCRTGEREATRSKDKCSGEEICCQCHARYHNCVLDL